MQIISWGFAQSQVIAVLERTPAYRKATRAMLMASAAIVDALDKQNLKTLIATNADAFGLIVGSSFGELETTKDFLKNFAESQVARPLLFQNSLHNSIAGFLSIQYKIHGPLLTVSHGYFAGEQALEAADLILQDQLCDLCLVTVVDTFVEELLGLPTQPENLLENAITFVLASETGAQKYNLKPIAQLQDLKTHRDLAHEKPSYALIAKANAGILQGLYREISSEKKQGLLQIKKPAVGSSSIQWTKL